jgi:hypothetical protein
MNDQEIQSIWNQAKFPEFSADVIRGGLNRQGARQFAAIRLSLGIGIGTLVLLVVLCAANLAGYWGNPLMSSIVGALGLGAGLVAKLGVDTFALVGRLERADQSLLERLKGLGKVFRGRLQVWNLIAAAAVSCLVFAINAWIDNRNGTYQVNQPGLFALIHVGLFAVYYIISRIGQAPVLSEIRMILDALETGDPGAEAKLASRRRRLLGWLILVGSITTAALLWAIWRSWQAAGLN